MASVQFSPAPPPRSNYTYEPLPTTELPRYEAPETTLRYLITELEVLSYSPTSTVYKGAVVEPGRQAPTPVAIKTDFYAKVTRPKDFQRESDMYELELEELQGVSIPRCFGLFQHVGENDRISSFLVLEYCGETLPDIRDVPREFKGRALASLYEIHRAGYIHGDLSYDNITNRNGRPFFIDLESAQPHTCELREKIFVGEEMKHVPCEEMRMCAGLLHVWAPDVQFLSNCTFPRFQIKSECIDSLIEKLDFLGYDSKGLLPHVKELIERVEAHRQHYRNIPPERRLIEPPKAKVLKPDAKA